MQRIRVSLPYFAGNGWEAEVVMVDENYTDTGLDTLLLQSIPPGIKIHKVKALNKKWTSKFGLGSVALRSLWFYRKKVDQLLSDKKYDLIYFSTTQFPVCILGSHWKNKFKIPYVIDMQDPWHSDYYQDKPKEQKPRKYWFSYRLNKYLEPKAIKGVSGLISVSDNYIIDLKNRYPAIKDIPSDTITFGAFEPDMQIAENNKQNFKDLLDPKFTNIVYIGRGGNDMHKAITPVFKALKNGLESNKQAFERLKFYFIGTSYAHTGLGQPTILPLAKQYGVEDSVVEITGRIPYYHTLLTLQQADALFIPGSDDPQYTASKIYPYLLIKKKMLAIFNKDSSAIKILEEYDVKHVYSYDHITETDINSFFSSLSTANLKPIAYNAEAINKYSARQMALKQCRFFNKIINA
jgi:hypothetical protein